MTDEVGLLLRRAGFGPKPAELAAARQAGYARTLSNLVAPPGPDVGASLTPIPDLGPDPFVGLAAPTDEQVARAHALRREQTIRLSQWWLDRVVVADHQAVERLQFFWQGHWATKVESAQFTLGQHRALREAHDFVDMAHRMVGDRALVYWLDGQHNRKGAPNENLARELCELFLLGIGNYSEKDVKEAARALTGYRVVLDRDSLVLDPQNHDDGPKTILGTTGDFTAQSLVDLLLRQKSCPRFVAARMWYRYASSSQSIPDRVRDRMVAAFPQPMPMLRAMFEDEAFATTAGGMAKSPLEWFVGALRHLGLRPGTFQDATFARYFWSLDALGQRPFGPPSVGGWPSGGAWLTSAAVSGKLIMAKQLVELVRPGPMTPEGVAYALCIDKWTDRTYQALRGVRDAGLLLTLGLVSPEYQVT